MQIKNYSSEVPAVRSVQLIEERLVEFGARNIVKTYGPDGKIAEVVFDLPRPDGKSIPIRLPARIDSVRQVMLRNEPRATPARQARIVEEQAPRTAWKIMFDWVLVQLSLISIGQAEALEVFLPYVATSRTGTYYESLKDNGFKALPMSDQKS
jgi:hypothetical protein